MAMQGSGGGGGPAGNSSAALSSGDDASEAYNATSFNGGAEGDEVLIYLVSYICLPAQELLSFSGLQRHDGHLYTQHINLNHQAHGSSCVRLILPEMPTVHARSPVTASGLLCILPTRDAITW